MVEHTRRAILSAGLKLPLLAGLVNGRLTQAAEAGELPRFGAPTTFDFQSVKETARRLAAAPYVDHPPRYSNLLEAIDYDAATKIAYRDAAELWPPGSGSFPVKLFHLQRYAKDPVRIFQVKNSTAREVLYEHDLFAYGDAPVLQHLPADLGFAGFRVLEASGRGDWLAFQSASYFRSAGELRQYGASARGIAINTVGPAREEFPLFTPFWIEEPADGSLVVCALLDGFSLAGAFRFVVRRETAVVMDVEAVLFPRNDIPRLGVAPLTSMLWYSESSRRGADVDWRPEVHDSDGLAILTGRGESLWRPLNNPTRVQTSSFPDIAPRGFGLLQRDRDFNNYQDDGAVYEKRPSVWIEPRGDWGEGRVELVEIPTEDEVHDNIVAYWLPKDPIRAGSEQNFAYRLTWAADIPGPPNLGRVIATRIGRGGWPGQPRPPNQRKFVVDFDGGPLAALTRTDTLEPLVTDDRGRVVKTASFQVNGTKRWRVLFDIEFEGDDPIDLRLHLARDGTAITETWVFEFLPSADPIGAAIRSKTPVQSK